MISPFREEYGVGKILTTESCCECYHDLFDMFLILDTTGQGGGFYGVLGADNVDALPLFKMIYGESAIAYGSGCKLEGGDKEFEFNFIRNILFGMIPTAEGIELAYKDELYKWAVMRHGVDFFKQNREVLIYGMLDDYITLGNGERSVTFNKLVKKCPEVIAAKYKYKDNEYLYAYNYTDMRKDVTLFGKKLSVEPKSFIRVQF